MDGYNTINLYNQTYFGDLNTKWNINFSSSITKRHHHNKWKIIVTGISVYMAAGGVSTVRAFLTNLGSDKSTIQYTNTLDLKTTTCLGVIGDVGATTYQFQADQLCSVEFVIDDLPYQPFHVTFIETNNPLAIPTIPIYPSISFRIEELEPKKHH